MRVRQLTRLALVVMLSVAAGCGRDDEIPVAPAADPQPNTAVATPADAAPPGPQNEAPGVAESVDPQGSPPPAGAMLTASAAAAPVSTDVAPVNAPPPPASGSEPAEAQPVAAATAPPAASVATPGAPAEPAGAEPASSVAAGYEVECASGATAAEQCQVDKGTYVGWRTFAAQCQVCHGGSALGSTFAPSLLDRFNQGVDYARFEDVVLNGFRGQVGAMPGWKENPQVAPNIDPLYRYLRARADNKLPPGRPAKKPG